MIEPLEMAFGVDVVKSVAYLKAQALIRRGCFRSPARMHHDCESVQTGQDTLLQVYNYDQTLMGKCIRYKW